MTGLPHWKTDFPIQQSEEHRIARRQFVKFACCSGLAFGAGWLGKDKLFAPPVATEAKLVSTLEQLPVGTSKLFRYPAENAPCILIRLTADRFAAYSQRCTHLMCPVHFNAKKNQLVCPCHDGFFSAEDGRVLAGPPRRPLPRYPVEVRGREIWVVPGEPKPA